MTATGFIYEEMIEELRQGCRDHLDNRITADALQRIVLRAEATIVAVGEQDIRDKMTNADGALELIKFTIEEDQQITETQQVARNLVAWLAKREKGPFDT